jgi:hypothetical protein
VEENYGVLLLISDLHGQARQQSFLLTQTSFVLAEQATE